MEWYQVLMIILSVFGWFDHCKKEKKMFHCLEKSNWLSSNVMFPSINVVINTACEIGKVSSKWTAGFNLPFRVMNMIAHRRANYQMVLEVAALAALFFPCGRYIAIAIDTISVGVSWYHDHTPTPGLSPTTRDIDWVSDEQYLAKWVLMVSRSDLQAINQEVKDFASAHKIEVTTGES